MSLNLQNGNAKPIKMETKLSFSKENIANAFKLHYNSKYPVRSRLMLLLGLILIISGLALTFTEKSSLPVLLKYIFILVGIAYSFLYFYRRNKLFERAANQKAFQGKFDFEINEKEISFTQNGGVSSCSWSKIEDVIQDDFSYLFYFGKNQFYILPKEKVTEEELQSIEKIISIVKK